MKEIKELQQAIRTANTNDMSINVKRIMFDLLDTLAEYKTEIDEMRKENTCGCK